MLDETQGQYLSFKKPTNTVTQTYSSQVVYTNRNICSTKGNIKPHTEQTKSPKFSKKEFQQVNKKSSRSNFQVISFSTDYTKKNKCCEAAKKQLQNVKQTEINQNLHSQYSKNRLTKAKSDIEILKTWEKNKKEELLSKKLIQEVLEEMPTKYKSDFITHQNQLNCKSNSQLIKTIKLYQVKIDRLQKEILIKNAKIKSLEKLYSQSSNEQDQVQSYLKPENRYFHQQNKQNVRRLLNMLKSTDEYKQFAQFALEDDGIVLLTQARKTNKTKIDVQDTLTYKKPTKIHYCSCNKEFIPEPYLWVPESIYDYGKQFLKSHQGQDGKIVGFMSKSEYELLLYELNRMWREREKRIVNTITHQKNLEIDKLKRKYNLHRQTFSHRQILTSATKIKY